MAVQRQTAAADQRQAGQQQGHEHQALVCVRRVHAGHRQDCCLNSCWTPSEVRLATLEVSSASNRNLCASIVTCSNWPGVGSLPLLVSACDMALLLSQPALRVSTVDSSTRMPSDGCTVSATDSAPPGSLQTPTQARP